MSPERELEITRLKMVVEPQKWDIVEIKSEGDTIKIGMTKTLSADVLLKERERVPSPGLPG